MIKTVAELKRTIKPGMLIKTTFHAWPECQRHIGETTSIVRVMSTQFTIRRTNREGKLVESYLSFPKASEFVGTEKGFILLDEKGQKFMEYEFVPSEAEQLATV